MMTLVMFDYCVDYVHCVYCENYFGDSPEMVMVLYCFVMVYDDCFFVLLLLFDDLWRVIWFDHVYNNDDDDGLRRWIERILDTEENRIVSPYLYPAVHHYNHDVVRMIVPPIGW